MNNSNETTNRIISLVFNTSRLIHEQSKKEKDHPDPFSMLRLETLRCVAEKKSISMKEVANYLSITPPSATSLVNPLVKSEMLKRVADKNDRRAICLSITPKGRKILKKGLGEVNRCMRKILMKLDAKEQGSIIKILEKLSKIYDKSNQK